MRDPMGRRLSLRVGQRVNLQDPYSGDVDRLLIYTVCDWRIVYCGEDGPICGTVEIASPYHLGGGTQVVSALQIVAAV